MRNFLDILLFGLIPSTESVVLLVTIVVFYVLGGWFYVHVLGKEFHDFVVFTVLVFILTILFFMFTNRNVQMLFFGS